ncbi:hypothetical protein MUN84_14725 [Hymenobacter sp. 5516J-16]|uniref:hypothetical protein n=1 Tax=Hymenobacter sp. 5516J-16 TaxID=2932253 RepID=UPI001FD08E2E|nr:hypothetical protein [Hymenobacter sp. 5516J-16]UOQ75879.1 hypothetical protein MUN84_14725 [Hymenobacter sp. 5516J-16]
MKTKYSHAKREQYGRLLASLLCDQHFGARPTATLDGPAVLRFTPIRQVNLFVVQQLLGKWTAEMTKLRSPYFDFEDVDVRQALTQFMNILSRRIKLSRPVFEPLLAQAITDTLGGALAPTEMFTHKLLGEATTCTPEQLREGLRYLDLNKPVFESFLATLPAQQEQERDYLVSRFRLHEEACAAELQPLASVLESFNVLLPLSEKELYEEPAARRQRPRSTSVVWAACSTGTTSTHCPRSSRPSTRRTGTRTKPRGLGRTRRTSYPKVYPEIPAEPRRPLADSVAGGAVPLYEKLKAEQPAAPSLSETLRQERVSTTLAEKGPRVESLREAISINQRFSFINELFNGENMEYHAAIQHLDTLPDASTAKRYVTENLTEQYGWVRKDEHINKLLKLIDRKFSN